MTKFTFYLLNFIFLTVLHIYLSAQETKVEVLPLSGSYIFYYDGNSHDLCGGSIKKVEDADTLHSIALEGSDFLADTIVLSNDHYGRNCFVYDICIIDTICFVNIFVPKDWYGSYVFNMTSFEQKLIKFAASKVLQYNQDVFMPENHSLNPSETHACNDCDAVSYIHIKNHSESMEYLIHHLADGIPDALIFLRDAIGAIVDNHCRNSNIPPQHITDYSWRMKLIAQGKRYHCPLGQVSESFILQNKFN